MDRIRVIGAAAGSVVVTLQLVLVELSFRAPLLLVA